MAYPGSHSSIGPIPEARRSEAGAHTIPQSPAHVRDHLQSSAPESMTRPRHACFHGKKASPYPPHAPPHRATPQIQEDTNARHSPLCPSLSVHLSHSLNYSCSVCLQHPLTLIFMHAHCPPPPLSSSQPTLRLYPRLTRTPPRIDPHTHTPTQTHASPLGTARCICRSQVRLTSPSGTTKDVVWNNDILRTLGQGRQREELERLERLRVK